MKRHIAVGALSGFVAMIVLTMIPSSAFPSGFGGNSLTGTGGMKTEGAAGGTKVKGTVYVEYYDYFTDTDSVRKARARVAVRLILNNDIAIIYCDNYDPIDSSYCYNGIRLVNGVGRDLQPIVVPVDDVPTAQNIITNALKAIVFKRFFNNNQNLGVYMKSVGYGVDTSSQTFPNNSCTNWFEPGCSAGIYPWPNPTNNSVDSADLRNIFLFDIEIAVK